MSAEKVPLLSNNIPSAVKFCASYDFQRHSEQQDLDSAFLGYKRRPWVQLKSKPNSQNIRETLRALFSTSQNNEKVDKLMEAQFTIRDFGSLSDEDLEIVGFDVKNERTEFLKMFAIMPNQDPSYEDICNSYEAQGYNNQIIGNAANHIMHMRSSLAATNYKLKMLPPEDLVLGDKCYASRFALDSLKSVKSISEELTKDLRKLEASLQQAKEQQKSVSLSKERKQKILYFTAIALGMTCAWFWWWSKQCNSPNLENIPLKT